MVHFGPGIRARPGHPAGLNDSPGGLFLGDNDATNVVRFTSIYHQYPHSQPLHPTPATYLLSCGL
ncbi:hypothetical protein QCA50_000984 [Cerrena zonata]|uniref:Uncharacterized protein n=1 Tax=Cerrena zonata TaxID=2478898 RepID=A0AAW0GSX4_9APHY